MCEGTVPAPRNKAAEVERRKQKMDLFDGFSGTEDGLKNSAFEAIIAELDKQEMK